MTDDPDKMVFRGIRVDFLDDELTNNYQSPWYSIVYEHMGFTHQGYYSTSILTICRYLITHFGMTEDEIYITLKPVTDEFKKACDEIEKED